MRDLSIAIDSKRVDEETYSGNGIGLAARKVLAQHLNHVLRVAAEDVAGEGKQSSLCPCLAAGLDEREV